MEKSMDKGTTREGANAAFWYPNFWHSTIPQVETADEGVVIKFR